MPQSYIYKWQWVEMLSTVTYTVHSVLLQQGCGRCVVSCCPLSMKMKSTITHYGFPSKFLSDQGTNFESQFIQDPAKLLGHRWSEWHHTILKPIGRQRGSIAPSVICWIPFLMGFWRIGNFTCQAWSMHILAPPMLPLCTLHSISGIEAPKATNRCGAWCSHWCCG